MIFLKSSRSVGTTIILLSAFTLTSLVGCSSEPEWHPVNTEESQVLALARFNNFDLGIRPFETEIIVQGQALSISGWVDYFEHTGYAGVQGDGFNDQILIWTPEEVAITQFELGESGLPPVQLPITREEGTMVRQLSPEVSNLDTLLMLLLSLGNDRPENPLLLQQAGALWLGTETVERDGQKIELDVYSTPPSEDALTAEDPQPTPADATVKMKLNDRAVLDSVEALLAGDWVIVTFSDPMKPAEPTTLPDIETLTTAP